MSVFARVLRALELPHPMPAERINRDLAIAGLDARDRIQDLEAALTEARRARAVPPQAYVNAEQIDLQRQHHELLERAADKQVANAREAAECAIKWLVKWRRSAHAKDEECTALRKDLAKSQALAALRAGGVQIPKEVLSIMLHHAKAIRLYKMREVYYAIDHWTNAEGTGDSPQAALDALAAKL